MMRWANVTEEELREKQEIETGFGETLSWWYLCYVRENPIVWKIPTCILYGGKNDMTSYETISQLAEKLNVSRQSVSKWESGQAVPEPDKIIALSTVFDE